MLLILFSFMMAPCVDLNGNQYQYFCMYKTENNNNSNNKNMDKEDQNGSSMRTWYQPRRQSFARAAVYHIRYSPDVSCTDGV